MLSIYRQPTYSHTMREPTYFLLASLVGEPLHGYGIAKRAELLSDGSVKLAAGTLYGAIDRLLADGSIEVDREETVEGRARRYYRITQHGVRTVSEAADRMRASVAVFDQLSGKAVVRP